MLQLFTLLLPSRNLTVSVMQQQKKKHYSERPQWTIKELYKVRI